MADGSKTREALLLEVEELRRQLTAAQEALKTGKEVGLEQVPAEAERQGLIITSEVKPDRSPAISACSLKLTARPDSPIKILLIEDNPGDARLIREMLAGPEAAGITLDWVPKLSLGLEYLGQRQVDLVLLDLSLPDSRGLETFCTAYTRAPKTPFVLLSGLDDETLALTAVQRGAQDYLIKGDLDSYRLLRAVHYAIERKRLQESLQLSRDELEHRVEARTADLVASNRKLQEETSQRLQSMLEQERLLAEVQNYSEELRITNEDLKIHGEELRAQNETLQAQAEELEAQKGELEQSARQLEAGQNLLRSVLEQMPAGVILADPSGQITMTNRRAEAIWRQSPGSLTDLNHFRLIPRFYLDGRPCPVDALPLSRALTLGQTVVDEEYLLQRDTGDHLESVYLNINATPVRDQHGSTIAAVATYFDITARKQAQAALSQSEARYRSLVELSPDAIVVHAQGTIVFVNPAAVKLFGAAVRSELLNQPFMDRIHPDFHDANQERIRIVRRGGTISYLEEKILRLDGEAVAVEATGNAIIYAGRPAVQSILRDITERNRAREALREANAKLQALIEASPLAIFHVTPEGIIQGVNPAAERIFGWRADELLGRPLPMVPADQWGEVRSTLGRVLRGEPLTGIEARRRRKDGTWIDVSLSIAPMYNENGQVTDLVSLVEDITSRKQSEAALAQSRAEFEAIFNSISDAVIFADTERRIVLANPAVEAIFGYTPKELIGLNAKVLYADPAEFKRAKQKYYHADGRVKPARFEITYRRKDGTIFNAESLASQVQDAQGHILGGVGIHRDITARKVAEAALQESQRQTSMLADLLENSSQPFIVGAFNGRLGMCNTAYLQLLGYSQQELSRLNWETDLTPPEWRELEAAKLEELRRTRQPVRYEKEYLRQDGSRVPVEIFAHLRRNEHGLPLQAYAFVTDITARKAAEAALKQERQRLFDLLEALPASVFLQGEDFSVRFSNRRCREIFGDTKNQTCYQAFHELQTPCEGCPSPTIIATQTSREIERTLTDGRTFQIYKYPFRDTDGSPCVLSLGMDITARKQAEGTLRKQAALLDLAHDAIIVRDLVGRITFWSRGAEETYGWTKQQAMGQVTYTLLKTDSPVLFETVERDLLNQGKWHGELRHTRADGKVLVVVSRQALQRDDAGKPSAILEINRDITERKQAEEALRESEARFRQLAENLDDAILLASADLRRLHYISPAYEHIWGRSCASLYQEPRSWLDSVVAADRDKVRTALRALISGEPSGDPFPEFRIFRPDGGERWILARFFPIRNEAGQVYRIAGLATDITARKEVEAVLRWRQKHLGQTAKMEAVGQLAGGVAHDFNNLLTVISGYGELLLADLQETDQKRPQVQAILKAAEQAGAVTRQLLAFSRKQVLQPQILDLNSLISGLVGVFSRLVDENIKISLNLAPGLGAVKADPNHMEQIVMNLAINAMDAMPRGGALTIGTANVQVAPSDTRRHPEVAPGAYVVVTVADTGVGMNQDILAHIFEPFFTTKERGKGTGLGLSMAYGIIKQSGGHILVESSPQQGSSFRIYLPRLVKTGKPAALAPSTRTDVQGTGTVLLVEDEAGVRQVVQRMLTLKGYSVLTAGDGQEALNISRNHPGPIHLLLTDVAMPVMGGRELAERLAPGRPEMMVLFMSGHTEDGMVRRGVRESVINFIQKPFRADQLLHKVRKLLGDPKP